MTTPLPGQRSAQRPMRAAVASQRALGRLVNAGGAMSGAMVLNVGGRWFEVGFDESGQERLVSYEFSEES